VRLFRLILIVVAMCAPSVHAKVVGDIAGIGFPGVGGIYQGRDLFRVGSWVPVVVDLRLEGEASFEGVLRISQRDKDGDLCVDRQRVQLLSDQGSRRYWLYAVAGRQTPFSVELLTSEGKRVEIESRGKKTWSLMPVQRPAAIDPGGFLVLSISSRGVGQAVVLQEQIEGKEFSKLVSVAHAAPRDLPSRWLGLEAVDAVVWDEADPTEISSAQLEALLEWTRQGGLLLVAGARTSDVIARSALADVLPVTFGAVRTVMALPVLQKTLLDMNAAAPYATSITVVTCTAKPGATQIVEENTPFLKSTVVARGIVGRGRVVFVGAALREIFNHADASPRNFFTRTLELRQIKNTSGGEAVTFFGEINGWIGFRHVGALYLVLAVVFAIAYVFLATFGSFGFLRAKGWVKHSWTVFAVFAGVASVLSIIGVQWVRGVGKRLTQLSVVDTVANDRRAFATAYLGLKTSMFTELDVWLAPEFPLVNEPGPTNCYVKPLPAVPAIGEGRSYIDPSDYRVRPGRAEALGVPIRGTVKQFEGRWSGYLEGPMVVELSVERGSGGSSDLRVSDSSTITNELGVDLYSSFLIYAARDVFLPRSWQDSGERWEDMYIFPLGPMDAGATVKLGSSLYSDRFGEDLDFDDWRKSFSLKKAIEYCRGLLSSRLGGMKSMPEGWPEIKTHEAALLMLTLFEEYFPDPQSGIGRFMTTEFSTANCRHLDVSSMIDKQNALLIGFSRSAGPVKLCTRTGSGSYRHQQATQALTMYRVRIPLAGRGRTAGAKKP
jgi:hypothetical protein